MKLILSERREDAGERLADTLAEAIASNPRIRLGLSAGRTSIHAYGALVQRFHERGGFSFRHVTAFGTDEYVGLSPADHRSTRYLMNFHLFKQVDLPGEQTFVPRADVKDPEAECKALDLPSTTRSRRAAGSIWWCSASATTATSVSTSRARRPRAACAW